MRTDNSTATIDRTGTDTTAGGTARRHRPEWAVPCAVAAALAVVLWLVGARGADYPAQLLRAVLWERSGPAIWNFSWYGGHATPTYSLVTPAAAALLGAFRLTAVSAVAATYFFSRLTTSLRDQATGVDTRVASSVANLAFAVAASVNVAVGRTAFAFGTALALAAVWAWHRRRTGPAIAAAGGAALASPVAAAFLAVPATAVALHWVVTRRTAGGVAAGTAWRAVVVAGAALLPVGVATFRFHEASRFPYEAGGVLVSLGALAALAVLVPHPVVRIAAALAAVAAVAVYVVPNPLGGNFSRLTQLFAVPLAVAALPLSGRRLGAAAAGAAAGLLWIVLPAVGAIADWHGDPSVEAAYHRPLVEEVRTRNRDLGRVGRLEIPFTENHWEAVHVAADVPYARGWLRQLDLTRNPELYDESLDLVRYRQWLLDNAVRWVALPDVPLDEGGRPEAALLAREGTERDIPWLQLVWQDAHWRLYEVAAHRPIVDPPARLVAQRVDRVEVVTRAPATVTIRYRHSPHLSITAPGRIEPGPDGWIRAHLPSAGSYQLGADLAHAAGLGP